MRLKLRPILFQVKAKAERRKTKTLKEECGEGPYDMDSAVSGMSPGTRYWTTIIESGTGKEVGFADNESEQDCFGSRRWKRQGLTKASISDPQSNCSSKKRRLRGNEYDSEDRRRTRVR
jgi:hypothetical protein